jgi:hypothetical protein
MDFPDKWAAIVWMCRNQLGRRNLSDVDRTVLIGEAYKAQKMSNGGDRRSNKFSVAQSEQLKKQCAQSEPIVSDPKECTVTAIGRDFGVGHATVSRAEQFVDGLNAADAVQPGFSDDVRAGKIKAPKNIIREIRNTPEEKRPAAVEAIKSGDLNKAKEIIMDKQKRRGADAAPRPL